MKHATPLVNTTLIFESFTEIFWMPYTPLTIHAYELLDIKNAKKKQKNFIALILIPKLLCIFKTRSSMPTMRSRLTVVRLHGGWMALGWPQLMTVRVAGIEWRDGNTAVCMSVADWQSEYGFSMAGRVP